MIEDRHLASAFKAEFSTPYQKPQLRVSNLPYCPILDVLERWEPRHFPSTYAQNHYFRAGTAVHSNIQAGMSYAKKLGKYVFGNWKCPSPGCTQKRTLCLRPKNLPKCKHGFGWEYVELAFRVGNLTGHCDLVTHYPNNEWVAWEFKTIGLSSLVPKNVSWLPNARHKVQIESYCVMLWLCYKIKVHRYNLVYLSRESPHIKLTKIFSVIFSSSIAKRVTDDIFRTIAAKKQVTQTLKAKEPDFDALLDHRPCHSANQYWNKMDLRFFGKEQCQFFKNGYCGKKKIPKMKKRLQQAWKNLAVNNKTKN